MTTINTDIAQKIDIIVRENNSSNITLNISNANGSSFDLSEYDVDFNVYLEGVTLITKSLGDGISLSANGLVISISISDTSIIPRSYKYRLVLSNDSISNTWMYGKFKINQD